MCSSRWARPQYIPAATPAEVPLLDSLKLPPVVKKFCDYHQGLVLVTGPTGTGKSTTLAAMIDHLNRHRKLNIVSLEDQIEFVHRSKLSQVIQRELHSHLPSFAEGVRASRRGVPGLMTPPRRSPRACAQRCARTRM